MDRLLFPSAFGNKPQYSNAYIEEIVSCGKDKNVTRHIRLLDVTVKNADGTPNTLKVPLVSVVCATAFSEKKTAILYFKSNDGDVEKFMEEAEYLAKVSQLPVLVPEYPGHGIADGMPTEESIKATALASLHTIDDDFKVIVMGKSFGSFPAIFLSHHERIRSQADPLYNRKIISLITYAAWTNVTDVYYATLKMTGLAKAEQWNTITLAPEIDLPWLLFHGTEDSTVPYSCSQRLYQQSFNAAFVTLPGAGSHRYDDLALVTYVYPAIRYFLANVCDIPLAFGHTQSSTPGIHTDAKEDADVKTADHSPAPANPQVIPLQMIFCHNYATTLPLLTASTSSLALPPSPILRNWLEGAIEKSVAMYDIRHQYDVPKLTYQCSFLESKWTEAELLVTSNSSSTASSSGSGESVEGSTGGGHQASTMSGRMVQAVSAYVPPSVAKYTGIDTLRDQLQAPAHPLLSSLFSSGSVDATTSQPQYVLVAYGKGCQTLLTWLQYHKSYWSKIARVALVHPDCPRQAIVTDRTPIIICHSSQRNVQHFERVFTHFCQPEKTFASHDFMLSKVGIFDTEFDFATTVSTTFGRLHSLIRKYDTTLGSRDLHDLGVFHKRIDSSYSHKVWLETESLREEIVQFLLFGKPF